MPPTKTERFEMRIDEELLARLDQWRAQEPDVPNRTEAVRRLLEAGLANASPRKSIQLSDGEKLLTMMMCDLYTHVGLIEGEINHKKIASAIHGGHLWAPKWEMPGLFHDHEDDPENVGFVARVLDMWDKIECSYSELSKNGKDLVATEVGLLGKNPKFMGFDGNQESELMSIAIHFIDGMDRFKSFKGRSMNSHAPMKFRYRNMVQVYDAISESLLGGELSAKQIISILNSHR
jgi:uncharacterized protein